VRQNAVLASAALVAAFPELQNLTPEQIPVAIKATLAADPDRARNMMRQIEATKDVMQQHQQVQQAQAQAYQQAAAREWQNYSRQNDDAYDAWSAYRPEAEVKAVKENVTRIMKEAYGVDEATLGHLYQTVPAFRSVQVQRMLHDLTVAHLARENIDAKRDRSYPVVQRPGSPEAREPEQNYRQRQLSSRLDGAKGQDALRIAAEMVTARRNARR
jgi:hypothetical protein